MGRYHIANLIERYGADFAGPDLRDKLSADCRNMTLRNTSGAICIFRKCSR